MSRLNSLNRLAAVLSASFPPPSTKSPATPAAPAPLPAAIASPQAEAFRKLSDGVLRLMINDPTVDMPSLRREFTAWLYVHAPKDWRQAWPQFLAERSATKPAVVIPPETTPTQEPKTNGWRARLLQRSRLHQSGFRIEPTLV
jgi:hypothetical protein